MPKKKILVVDDSKTALFIGDHHPEEGALRPRHLAKVRDHVAG